MQVLTSALLGLLFITGTATADASSTPAADLPGPTYTVSMTAYNATPAQTDDTPDITASGAYSNSDIMAARSQDLAGELPFGTIIAIESATSSPSCGYGAVGQLIGLRVIADSMNAKMHNKIDIMLPQKEKTADGTENPAVVLGVCRDVTIKVVGHVDVSDIPQTQAELASALGSAAELAVAK